MYLLYQQHAVTAAVKTLNVATFPSGTNGAMLQAEGADVRYTLDNTTDPTPAAGMLLKAGLAPEPFLVDDLIRLRFVQSAPGGSLNVHYWGGRAI